MREEEIEAIEFIKSIININKENERTTVMLYVSDVDILLNLIEKLEKENEELKKNQRYKKDNIFSLEYDKETLRDMVLEKQEEIKELKSNSIPKDKIKEIIKDELPEDEICETCKRYDVNGVVIKQKLIKLLEEE